MAEPQVQDQWALVAISPMVHCLQEMVVHSTMPMLVPHPPPGVMHTGFETQGPAASWRWWKHRCSDRFWRTEGAPKNPTLHWRVFYATPESTRFLRISRRSAA